MINNKTMKTNDDIDYVPFSEQWEIEMMKFDKKSLIKMLKIKLRFIEQYQEISDHQIETFREFLMRSQFAFPQSEEDINHFHDGLNPKMMDFFLKAAGLSTDEINIPNQGWDDMSVAQPEFVKRKAYDIQKIKLEDDGVKN